MTTILQMWLDYRKAVIPKDASAIQINECMLAFYAGFHQMQMVNYELGGAHVSEDAACVYLEGLKREMESFHKSLDKIYGEKRRH